MKSKDNSSVTANAGNNKNKDSNQKENYQNNNTKSSANKKSSTKCIYCGQDGHLSIKCFKTPQGESHKSKPDNSTGSKKRQFNDMNTTEAE